MTLPADRHPGVSSQEFALLVDAVEDYAIFLMSPKGEIRSWNRGAARIMGYDESEAIGRHFSMFYGPRELEAKKPQHELGEAARDGRVEDEGWRVRKDGTRFWANTVITLLRDPDGSVHGYAKVTRDMTARRQAEENLRHSTEIFQLLVSSVREYAIFLLDPSGIVATWNVGAQRIKGYTPEEIIGRSFSEFYTEEDKRAGRPQRVLNTAREKGSVEDEGWRVRKDGSRFWANVVITAVHDAHGELRGFAKVTRDVTERKEAQETQRAYRVAQEANRAKDEFLMTLSHELRTPMTAILGWARMLPTLESDSQLFDEAIASIVAAAQLQGRLIDDLLDVSRIVSGKLRLAPEPVEVANVVMAAVDALAPTAAAKGVRVSTSFGTNLGSILADPTRLQQVIWNLLSNSIKFTPEGGAVEVSAKRSAANVQINVRDNGEGIESEFLPHMFEPFRQAESPQTRTHGGLGLGLSIVRYIAEAHGGSVSAESEGKGRGASFTVTLPVRKEKTRTDASPRTPRIAAFGGRLTGLHVVLVEDDAESAKMIGAALRAAGAELVSASNGKDALIKLADIEPDVIVTDIAMPEMDGLQLTKTLRDRGARMKIIALSAFPPGRGEPNGFDAWLSKPFDPFHLVEQIARIAAEPSAST